MAKKKGKAKRPARQRASWKGNLAFGMVSIPVQAFNALNREESDIRFHQLHAGCHRRIHYAKTCPVHGEVANDEIVSGYEYKKGKYVEIAPEELAALRSEQEHSLTIDAFIPHDAVDPIYFDGRMYYLLPADESAQEPYEVIAQAMQREERYGIGPIIFSGKEQLALIRPVGGVLQMAMLNYNEEIRLPKELGIRKRPSRPTSNDARRKIQLAQALVRSWSVDNFDFDRYDDDYRQKVEQLIQAKLSGGEIAPPPEVEETADVINLMEALKQSVAALKPPRGRKGRKKRRPA